MAEAKIPYDAALKPNQTAIVKILDYAANNAVVIPVNLVQSDETSKYVYVLEKQSNGKTVAKKKAVTIGEVYGQSVEIKLGLSAGEQLITEGYQSLYEGQECSLNKHKCRCGRTKCLALYESTVPLREERERG